MKHPWEHIIIAFAADTSLEIEGTTDGAKWFAVRINDVVNPLYCDWKFRLKPTMCSITLQDGWVVEWPEPMRVAPKEGTQYWVASSSGAWPLEWYPQDKDSARFRGGFCHLTEEAAQQHRKAIVLANGGEL